MRTASLLFLLLGPPVAAQNPEPKYEGKPLSYWVERFQTAEKDDDRTAASNAIRAFDGDAAPAVPQLVGMLEDRSPRFRHQVGELLRGLGPDVKGLVPELTRVLEEKRTRHPDDVVGVLVAFGPKAKEAIPAIRPVVREWIAAAEKDPDAARMYSAAELHQLGPAALPLLLEMLDARADDVKRSAVRQVDKLGPDAIRQAAPRLAALLGHEDRQLRYAAATALWTVEKNPAVVPALAPLLSAGDQYSRLSVAFLGEIGPGAKEALPALREAEARGAVAWYFYVRSLKPDGNDRYLFRPVNDGDYARLDHLSNLVSVGWAATAAIRKIEGKPGTKE